MLIGYLDQWPEIVSSTTMFFHGSLEFISTIETITSINFLLSLDKGNTKPETALHCVFHVTVQPNQVYQGSFRLAWGLHLLQREELATTMKSKLHPVKQQDELELRSPPFAKSAHWNYRRYWPCPILVQVQCFLRLLFEWRRLCKMYHCLCVSFRSFFLRFKVYLISIL